MSLKNKVVVKKSKRRTYEKMRAAKLGKNFALVDDYDFWNDVDIGLKGRWSSFGSGKESDKDGIKNKIVKRITGRE
jgi:hypothetical protein